MPDGIITQCYGPIEGRHHDEYIVQHSGVLPVLANLTDRDGNLYITYGDKGYSVHQGLLSPYWDPVDGSNEQVFNTSMSRVRQSVEWGFNLIKGLFAWVGYPRNQKLNLQPIGRYFVVAAILTNCHTCCYGSMISRFFLCEPPTVAEYLSGRVV